MTDLEASVHGTLQSFGTGLGSELCMRYTSIRMLVPLCRLFVQALCAFRISPEEKDEYSGFWRRVE